MTLVTNIDQAEVLEWNEKLRNGGTIIPKETDAFHASYELK